MRPDEAVPGAIVYLRGRLYTVLEVSQVGGICRIIALRPSGRGRRRNASWVATETLRLATAAEKAAAGLEGP